MPTPHSASRGLLTAFLPVPLILVGSAHGEPLFPSGSDNYWRLESSSSPSYEKLDVIGTANIFGVEASILEVKEYDSVEDEIYYEFVFFKELGDDVYTYAGGGVPTLAFRRGPVGTQWKSIDSDGAFTARVIATGTFTVPAGKFDNCYHFKKEQSGGEWQEVLCDGVGMIGWMDVNPTGPNEVFMLTDYRVK